MGKLVESCNLSCFVAFFFFLILRRANLNVEWKQSSKWNFTFHNTVFRTGFICLQDDIAGTELCVCVSRLHG